MEDKVLKRRETVKVIRGVRYAYENLIIQEPSGQQRFTSRCLGRLDEELQPDKGIIRPSSRVTGLWAFSEPSLAVFSPLEGDSGSDPTDRNETPQENVSEALSVGDRVTHRLVPGLVAEITSVDTTKVKAHLLQVPPEREWLSQAQGWGWELSFAVKYLELVE